MPIGNFDRFRYYAALDARTNKQGPLHSPAGRFGGAHHPSRFGGSHRSRSIAAGQAEAAKRIARVRAALEGSERLAAKQLLATFANLNIHMVLPLLLSICHDIGLYLGGSILLGALVGGTIGFMGGGVGAAPGAIAGGTIGAQLGTVIMTFLGLKAVVEYMVASLPRAYQCYKEAFMAAWGLVDNVCMPGHPHGINPLHAETKFAEGHVLIILAFLTGLVAYLTRGKGDMKAVLAEIRANPRLGGKMADWLAQNGERLIKHPDLQKPLQATSHGSTPARASAAPAQTGSGAPVRTAQAPASKPPAPPPKPPAKPPAKPPLRPAAQVLGKTEGGPGMWASSPVRPKGWDYQEQISGVVRGVEYDVPFAGVPSGKVRFDGYDAQRKVLLDAKNWERFPPDNSDFWHKGTLREAQAQIEAAKGMPIEWHFSTRESLQAVRLLFREQNISGIKLINTPAQ